MTNFRMYMFSLECFSALITDSPPFLQVKQMFQNLYKLVV